MMRGSLYARARIVGAIGCANAIGCGHAPPPPPTPVAPPPQPQPIAAPVAPANDLAVVEAGIIGLDSGTRATLTALRGKLAGFDVRPHNDNGGLVFDVYRNNDKLLYVVPNDDGTLFNVHVVSSKATAPHGWKVGGALATTAGLECVCWGAAQYHDEIAACYHKGEHVAIIFERACAGALETERDRKVLEGATIQRIVWEPAPWGSKPSKPDAANAGGAND